jgi:hypothetical protein
VNATRAKRINGSKKPAVDVVTLQMPDTATCERSLIGAVVLAACSQVVDAFSFEEVQAIRPAHFADELHQAVWNLVLQIRLAGGLPDTSAITDRMKITSYGDTTLHLAAGGGWLAKLITETPNVKNVHFYASEVIASYAYRQTALAFTDSMRDLHNGKPAEAVHEAALQRLGAIEWSASTSSVFRAVDADELFTTSYQLDWLVRGMIVKLQPGLLVGPKKALKTTIGEDLAVSLSAGVPFMGYQAWQTERCRVLFCSAESGDATIAETAKRIAFSKGIDFSELVGWLFHCWSVPLLDNAQHLEDFRRLLRAIRPHVIICDPAYLMFGGDADASNLFSMGARLRALNDLCAEFSATMILVHHFKKGRSDSGTPQLEDVAFAGFQEFCRQWLMLDREDEYKPGSGEHKLVMSWGGSAGQSGEVSLTVSEGINDGFGGERFWSTEVLDRKAKEERAAETKSKAEQDRADEARQRIDAAFVSAMGNPLTKRELADRCGCDPRSKPHLAALGAMIRSGKVESTEITKANKQTYEAYLRKWGNDEQPEASSESAT